jgi:hypothetical protein
MAHAGMNWVRSLRRLLVLLPVLGAEAVQIT